MIQLLYGFFIYCHLALLVFSFTGTHSPGWRLWFLRLMLAGVLFDCITVLLSPQLIDQPIYYALNQGRYAIHALLLPLLIPFGLSLLKQNGFALNSRPLVIIAAAGITLAALLFGVQHEIIQLQLGEKIAGGHSRLAAVGDVLPPLGTIIANFLLLIMAGILWRKSGWKWLFLGTLFIFIINAAFGSNPLGFVIGNAAEIVFIASLLMTERWMSLQSPSN